MKKKKYLQIFAFLFFSTTMYAQDSITRTINHKQPEPKPASENLTYNILHSSKIQGINLFRLYRTNIFILNQKSN